METNEDYYISRNALLEHFDAHVKAHQVGEIERDIWFAAYEDVDNFDLADVVPVVRCGECKWYDSAFYACSKCGICVEHDFFCADGERIKGDMKNEIN